MPRCVLIIQNDPPETLGLYETYLREKAQVTLIQAYNMKPQEQFPPTDDFDVFIIGPTPISANDAQKHGFLRKEWGYLQQIIDSGKPTLGVCCGGQMLARLQGGEVHRSPSKEIGGYTVALTDHGLRDPLFRGFPANFPVFHWHQDMFTVPPGGQLLATGTPCTIQAYAKDNIRGLIFHLEITHSDAERWADAYPEEPAAIGKTREQALEECREAEPEMRRLAERLVDNLLAIPPLKPR
ncbi:MAG: type 1 glutamine amidotransferase [Candidatus Bathyarchaeota archaeon]